MFKVLKDFVYFDQAVKAGEVVSIRGFEDDFFSDLIKKGVVEKASVKSMEPASNKAILKADGKKGKE